MFVVAGVVGGYAVNMLAGSPEPDMPLLDRVLVWAKLVWLLYLPIAVLSGAAILLYNPRDDFHLERRSQSGDYLVVFQVTTRGFNKGAVERSVKSVLYWAPRYLWNYEVWVVTEDDVDKEFFEGLRGLSSRVKVVYVPRDYRTPNNTRYKARALHYAMELRKKLGYNPEKTWVYLMDEESIVGEDTVLGIIDFIENESPKGKLVGQGLIVYGNFWGRNWITTVADGIRPVWELGMEWLSLKIISRKYSWKGSHLLVRADVEYGIGWDFGVFGDDLVFGLTVQRREGVGWIKGKAYEQSPFNIRDFIQQRVRWYVSTIDIIKNAKQVKLLDKVILFLKLILWHSGLPLSLFMLFMLYTRFDFISLIILFHIIGSMYVGALFNSLTINENLELIKRIKILVYLPVSIMLTLISPWVGLYMVARKEMRYFIVKK